MKGITTYLLTNVFTQDWIVDLGSSHYITTNKNLLYKSYELTKSLKDKLHFPIGDKVEIEHTGDIVFF